MAKTTAETLRRTRKAIASGDLRGAWQQLEPLLQHPNSEALSPDELAAAWALFEKVCPSINAERIAPLVNVMRHNQDDVRALYHLGQALIENDLPTIAATPLTIAKRLAVGGIELDLELTAALETIASRSQSPI
jgi:hypothetical protein